MITFSLGIATGWATINLVELKNENSTFPTGPLTMQESSLVVWPFFKTKIWITDKTYSVGIGAKSLRFGPVLDDSINTIDFKEFFFSFKGINFQCWWFYWKLCSRTNHSNNRYQRLDSFSRFAVNCKYLEIRTSEIRIPSKSEVKFKGQTNSNFRGFTVSFLMNIWFNFY